MRRIVSQRFRKGPRIEWVALELAFFQTAIPRPDGLVPRRKAKHRPEAAVAFISAAVRFSGPFGCMEALAVALSC